MMIIIRYITCIVLGFYALNLGAQSYSGLWLLRDDSETGGNEYEYIDIEQRTDGSLIGKLYYYENVYDFISSKPYTVRDKAYKVCKLFLIKMNGQSLPFNKRGGCKLLLYNNVQRTNRIDFINYSSPIAPHSMYAMGNVNIATQHALADVRNNLGVKEWAIKKVKDLFIATVHGNVVRLKQLMTPEFYRLHYPYSDECVKKRLLSVPYERRKNMINLFFDNAEVTTIVNGAGDVVNVILVNKVNNKLLTIQLGDEYGTGDWRVFEYDYR